MVPTDRDEQELYEWAVASEHAQERLDKHVADSIEGHYSRTQIQQWIKSGDVTVNGNPAKANYKVQENDTIAAAVPEPVEPEIVPEDIPLDVIYEDGDVIVIDKPRGMVVHPALGHYTGTVVNGLMFHCKDLSGINGVLRPGIVHRIDKDTSGLLMAAKNDASHSSLAAQLKDHTVTRKYIAVVHGRVEHDIGTVDAPIGRDSHDRKLFTVTQRNGKHAVTHFSVLERIGDAFTVLELKLETGRTHQIRVHMKFIGHHLVGDPAYGRSKDKEMDGQALHAAVLGFRHPRTDEYLEFEAPLPEDMNALLARLRNR